MNYHLRVEEKDGRVAHRVCLGIEKGRNFEVESLRFRGFGEDMSWFVAVFLVFAGVLCADETVHLSGAGRDAKVDRLSFTGTQRWGAEFLKSARMRPKYLARDWKGLIGLPAPPANSSKRTEAEIAFLKTLVPQRTERMKEITAEIHVTNFRFGDHTYKSLTTDARFRATGKMLLAAYHDLGIATFVMKQKFNRVRPSILSEELDHVIEIPAHPAYPSGHATGAFTLAYLLQELDPNSGKIYLSAAQRIAENREIAGVHYPGDSEAGRLLARQLADQLLSHPSFKRLMKEARKEWGGE